MTITTPPSASTMASLLPTSEEMSSLYPAFVADDTLIEIIPSFGFDQSVELLSSISIGPFQAGIPACVPLWMALFLQARNLARLVPPSWLTTSNLANIIQYEKRTGTLFADKTKLPLNYYEITQRLIKGSSATSQKLENADALQLLVQDLLDVRMDKLRQQFQNLLAEQKDPDLIVNVSGIGSQELAILKRFTTQALQDYHALAKPQQPLTNKSTDVDENAGTAEQNLTAALRTRRPLRHR